MRNKNQTAVNKPAALYTNTHTHTHTLHRHSIAKERESVFGSNERIVTKKAATRRNCQC